MRATRRNPGQSGRSRSLGTALLALLLGACGGDNTTAANATAGAATAPPPRELVYTAIPDQDPRQLQERFAIVTDALADALDIRVRYVPVKSYAAAVTAFVNDEVQLAWFGGLSGVQARLRQPGAQAIAQGVEDPNYHSLLIAHHSTGLAPSDKLEDTLRGLTLTFGSKGSTSGRLMPEFFFRQRWGETPDQIFSRIGYSGDHSRTIALVASGAYQLGVLGYTTWDKEVALGKVDKNKVQVIWRSPGYPDYQWTIRGDVDARFGAGFTQKVQTAIINMKNPELLSRFPRSGFIAASNADYAPIADTAEAVGLIERR